MLSIIVSWRDRVELARSLPSLLAVATQTNGQVCVVNFSGNENLLAAQLEGADGPLTILDVRGEQYFNKSRAHNIGIASTTSPYLFFCDCDIVLEPEVLTSLLDAVALEPETFGTLAGVRESEVNSRKAGHVSCFGYELKIRTADGRVLQIIDNEEDANDGTRQAPGLLLARRQDLLAIGGYNGNLIGWGWEDQDMIGRLTLGRGLRRVSRGQALHLSHDDLARVANYPITNRWESRDKMFRQALANYDRADFRGTLLEDARKYGAAMASVGA